MAPFKVIIVGGGLAGALLANGLQNHAVDVTVYERDEKDTEREGYQIRLGESAMLGFRACLRDQDVAAIARSFGQSSESGSTAPTIMSPQYEEILNLTAIPSYAKSFAISRVGLYDILTGPLVRNGRVKYGNAFSRCDIIRDVDGNERVSAYFSDSSFDDCDILIGADGSRSRVNGEVGLQNLVSIKTHWSFLAKGNLTMEQVYELPSQLRRGPILVFANGVYIGTDGSDHASFFWVLSIPRSYSPEYTDVAEIPDRLKFCLDFIQDWDPRFKQLLLTAAKDDGTADIYVAPLRASTKPSPNWRTTLESGAEPCRGHPRIWLIGDAIHAMQANRGQGANQALHDCAEALPELLSLNEIAKSGETLSIKQINQACARYEDKMLDRAFAWVKKSGGTSIARSCLRMTSIPYYKMEEPKNSKCTPKSELKILSQETSVEMGYRRVQAGNRIHYLTINCDVYDESTMSRPYLLIPRLPEFPDTGWTAMHVSRGLYGSPVSTISYESLPSIESTWHPEYIDILSLHWTKRYTANFHQVLFNGCPAISKIACWEWEIPRLENETYVYKILSEHKDPNELPITPAILGHLTENGRVIGMLLEKVEGGFASLNDLAAYERILRRVHSMGITHGDVNRYNFLIDPSGGQVRLIDWEHAEVFDAKKATQELESLSNELTEET